MKITKNLKIVLLGPQASGKGTQGKLLSELFDIPRISTGEIFRDQISKETKLGLEVKDLIANGQLISDDVTFKLLKKGINLKNKNRGFILDGFPRNIHQVRLLSEVIDIDLVVEIDIPNKEAVKRIKNRRICSNCGASYDIKLFPPKKKDTCDKCRSKIIKRADDYSDAIKKRLDTYRNEVRPIIRFYKKNGLLVKVSGIGKVDPIFDKLKIKILKKIGAYIIE